MVSKAEYDKVSPGTTRKIFVEINDKSVDDIQLEVFYKPHTISLLLLCVFGLTYTAFVRDSSDHQDNLFTGLCGVFVFFMIVSVLAFPNGPFTRPHPIMWRMVFGCSVLYLLVIQFLIHLDYDAVRSIIIWFDPKMVRHIKNTHLIMQSTEYFFYCIYVFIFISYFYLFLDLQENYTIDSEKEYGVNCNDITVERLWSHFDWFAFGHYWGWGMKALIIRLVLLNNSEIWSSCLTYFLFW